MAASVTFSINGVSHSFDDKGICDTEWKNVEIVVRKARRWLGMIIEGKTFTEIAAEGSGSKRRIQDVVEPSMKFVCISYSNDLSQKHAGDCRAIMQIDWYRQVFPNTVLPRGGNSEMDFKTTKGGGRLMCPRPTTSVLRHTSSSWMAFLIWARYNISPTLHPITVVCIVSLPDA